MCTCMTHLNTQNGLLCCRWSKIFSHLTFTTAAKRKSIWNSECSPNTEAANHSSRKSYLMVKLCNFFFSSSKSCFYYFKEEYNMFEDFFYLLIYLFYLFMQLDMLMLLAACNYKSSLHVLILCPPASI